MKIENDYKVLTQEETIKRLKEMLQTQQPYGYNNDTIYNAIDYLNLLLMIIENEDKMIIKEHQKRLLDIRDMLLGEAYSDKRISLVYAVDIIDKYQKLQSDYEKLRADLEVILDKNKNN